MDQTLIDTILQLKPAERVILLDIIHGSLDRPDTTIDETWHEEAERRLAAFKANQTRGIPVEQVLGQRP